MKKIMFNDRFGQTQAVIDEIKINIRRSERSLDVLPLEYNPFLTEVQFEYKDDIIIGKRFFKGSHAETYHLKPQYQIGEEVAVAQSYEDCGWCPMTLQQTYVKKPTIFTDLDPYESKQGWIDLPLKYHKGWRNKMFVLAGLMPHRIRITDIRVERLQDISDEDCMKEGVKKHGKGTFKVDGIRYTLTKRPRIFYTPKQAFECLIDKICGKGTWQRNPWVWVYTFELTN